jgi:hypothetical protein
MEDRAGREIGPLRLAEQGSLALRVDNGRLAGQDDELQDGADQEGGVVDYVLCRRD